jgi:hypothetical protein
MPFTKENAIEKARQDLAARLHVKPEEIQASAEDAEFPDMALGASVEDEMSGQMITPGWCIKLKAGGRTYEYRANKHQLRLFDFKGTNYKL